MSKKVLVGMSGGVDSSVAALLLKEQGYTVAGVTLKLCENGGESAYDAQAVCQKLSIEHYFFDLCEEFKNTVISDFISEYKEGRTPNPCIVCNKYIKFGEMLNIADRLGFDMIATGHYAVIDECDGRYLLKRALDLQKDQSYVLYNLTQPKLARILFPLGSLTKQEIREKALKAGFLNAEKRDSQDICFVPDGNYAGFIEKSGFVSEKGDYVDIGGNFLGEHKGIINYTIGQRKGLGIALGKPQFVIDKDAKTGRVILGDEEHLFKTEVFVKDISLVSGGDLTEKQVTAKLRYRHTASQAVLYPMGDGMAKLVFTTPQRAPSSGQAAVFYDGDTVLGGGIII